MRLVIDHCFPLLREDFIKRSASWSRMIGQFTGLDIHVLASEVRHDWRAKHGLPGAGPPVVQDGGVTYHFVEEHHVSDSLWLKKLSEIDADVYFSNSYPNFVSKYVENLRAKTIIRLHGEPKVMLRHAVPGKHLADLAIVPWEFQIGFLKELSVARHVTAVQFGIETDVFKNYQRQRDIDFIGYGSTWLKNSYIIKEVFTILKQRGFKTHILYGHSKPDMVNLLNRGQVLFHPSLTEGVSRLLSEAAACGVLPVVDQDVESTASHARLLSGRTIKIGAVIEGEAVVRCAVASEVIADQLAAFRDEAHTGQVKRQELVAKHFNIDNEVRELVGILKTFV